MGRRQQQTIERHIVNAFHCLIRLIAFCGVLFQFGRLELEFIHQHQHNGSSHDAFVSPNMSPWLSRDAKTIVTNGRSPEQEEEVFEIVTTDYGWTSHAKKNSSRRIVTGEFFRSILAHPRYNASANWSDLEKHPDPSRRLIIFMDVDTCLEMNYPIYGRKDWRVNMEDGHPAREWNALFEDNCPLIARASNSPALLANPHSRLIILDCSGGTHLQLRSMCTGENNTSMFLNNDQVTVAYTSVNKHTVRPTVDIGLPPPAIKHASLSDEGRTSLRLCEKRKYLFSFQGRDVYGRKELFRNLEKYHGTFTHIKFDNQASYVGDIQKGGDDSNDYITILTQSVFAGAPRGDQLFSYRFSEILSAGAIPVIYSSELLLPFHTVINWTECAVLVEAGQDTLDILRAIHPERVCEMQMRALDAWDTYISSRSGWLRGLVDVALTLPHSSILE